MQLQQSCYGGLLGAAVGDAIGLPREGLSPRRARRLFGGPPLRHALVAGRGFVSDDGEHSRLTARALAESGGDPDAFRTALAGRLRWWIAALPPGVGRATLIGCLKLWLGAGAGGSGINSAGNGPLMRSPLIGLVLGHDRERMLACVGASTRLTHASPLATLGAEVMAIAADGRVGAGEAAAEAIAHARAADADSPLIAPLELALRKAERGTDVGAYAVDAGFGRGVSGYIVHTAAAAMFCAVRHRDDFRAAVEAAVILGGDSDTTASVVGMLVGARLGADAVPREWVERLVLWPSSLDALRSLAGSLASRCGAAGEDGAGGVGGEERWLGGIVRNAGLYPVIVGHVVRRLMPPY